MCNNFPFMSLHINKTKENQNANKTMMMKVIFEMRKTFELICQFSHENPSTTHHRRISSPIHDCCYERVDFIASHFSSHTEIEITFISQYMYTSSQGCDMMESLETIVNMQACLILGIHVGNHVVMLKENCMKFITFQMPHMDFLRDTLFVSMKKQ